MTSGATRPIATSNVLAVIMGGGAGTRLFPLTKERAKPAVPLAGKYRLVDIPISNCLNSELRRIYVLTQFNSASLHRHINQTYRFDRFAGGCVEILAARQTPDNAKWYQGTADAVRQNLRYLLQEEYDYIVINRDIEQSVGAVRSILLAERLKRHRQTGLSEFVSGLQAGR